MEPRGELVGRGQRPVEVGDQMLERDDVGLEYRQGIDGEGFGERADSLIERDQLGISRVEGQRPVHAPLHRGDRWQELVRAPCRTATTTSLARRKASAIIVSNSSPVLRRVARPLLQQVSVRERHVVGAQLDRRAFEERRGSPRPEAKRQCGDTLSSVARSRNAPNPAYHSQVVAIAAPRLGPRLRGRTAERRLIEEQAVRVVRRARAGWR